SNGQGHETVYVQFLSDQTGIPVEMISVVQGDSDRIEQGGGTGGSRSVTNQTNATLATVDKMIRAFTPYLAEKMGVD
ncbi:MAG: molybdopterin cofactor-binding domain-containing protein, partial [Paracoccaceae bacterium]